MKTEENKKLGNDSIRLLEYLKTFRKLHILIACLSLLGLATLLFVYRPLVIKSHDVKNRLNELEILLSNHRHAIAASKQFDINGKIIRRTDVPLVIAELARKGREFGLDFNSITPDKLQDTDLASISKLPVNFTIESEYKNLGRFLAFIEEFQNTITEVERFSICRHDKNSQTLSAKLILCLYVET